MNNDQNLKKLHEMVFVYNAVMDGWSVKKMRNGKIRLKKKSPRGHSENPQNEEYVNSVNLGQSAQETLTRQYELNLVDFIKNNTQINKIFNF